jgi:hypothetical protein
VLAKAKQDELHAAELIESQPDKFEILVDTLSEVIGTYMKHKE